MQLRIRQLEYSGLFVIDEIVHTAGLYITWDEKYETEAGALEAIKKYKAIVGVTKYV